MAATGTLKVDSQTINATTIKNTELTPTKRLNGHSVFAFTLIDKEGALYGTDIGGGTNWEDSLGKTVTFQHSDTTYNFVGRVQKLNFKGDSLDVACVGASSYANDYPLSADEGNFIIDTGYVNGDPTNYQGVDCDEKDSNGDDQDFSWDENFSLYTERDIGVVFQDTSNTSEKTWDSSGGAVTGTDVTTTNTHTSTQTEDGTTYKTVDNSDSYDATVTITCTDTVNKIDAAGDIHSIRMDFNAVAMAYPLDDIRIDMSLWDDGNSQYVSIGELYVPLNSSGRAEKYEYTDEKDPFIISDNCSDYLYDSGAAAGDRDTIKIKFTYTNRSGPGEGGGEGGYLSIDYLAFTIKYSDTATDPIMAKVYGNGPSTLYLTDGIYDEDGETWVYNSCLTGDFYRGHADVVKMDANGDTATLAGLNDSNLTFEVWVLVTDITSTFEIRVQDTGNNLQCKVHSDGDNDLKFVSGDGTTVLTTMVANTWYHIGISVDENVPVVGDVCGCYLNTVAKATDESWIGGANAADDIIVKNLDAVGYLYIDALGYDGDDYTWNDNWLPTGGIASYTQGVRNDDYFMTGYNTTTVLHNVFAKVPNLAIDVDPNFDKYFPRNCRGKTAMEVLEEVCELEGASWYEEYDSSGNCIIGVRRDTAFDNSDYKDNSHAITTANYEWDFNIEREYNHYKGVRVIGNPNFDIDVYVEDTGTNTSDRVYNIIDEKVYTEGEAYQMGYRKLQTLKSVQPSIQLNIEDDYVQQLDAGKDVTFTCARPTLTGTYPIRRITYHYGFPLGKVWAELWLGLGHSPPDEKLANQIEKGIKLARKIQTDKLDPTNVIGTPAFSHSSLSNVSANQHHTAYTNSDAVSAIEAESWYQAMIEGALPLGESNSVWVSCKYYGNSATTYVIRSPTGTGITNIGGTDAYASYECPLATETNNYHLVVDAVRLHLLDYDDGDYVSRVMVSRATETAQTMFFDETHDITQTNDGAPPLEKTYTFAADGGTPGDMSCDGYNYVRVHLDMENVAANDLDITGVQLRCWYEAD